MKLQICKLAGTLDYGILVGEDEMLDCDTISRTGALTLERAAEIYPGEEVIGFDDPRHYSNKARQRMNKQTVNVLAAIDRAADAMVDSGRFFKKSEAVVELRAARAAVAELIEAAGVVTKKTSAGHFAFAGTRELERLAAIVAKVQP